MAAPRLLVLADPKMLPALANGLREAGRFDVLPIPLSDGGAAAAAAPRADAVAVFYGAPGHPLAATVQMLATTVRGKGGRIVAVLQGENAAQRDECFRAGACDLFFMPMRKEQFVSRLEATVSLAYTPQPGARADVQVSSRNAQVKLTGAIVSAAGVQAEAAVPFSPGETVRISVEANGTPLQIWGLVATSTPETRIRFAGLTPAEEARVQEWVKKAAASAPGTASAAVTASAPLAASGAAGSEAPTATSTRTVPGAPLAGPPPGFADRPRVRAEAAGASSKPQAGAGMEDGAAELPDLSELPTPPMVSPVDLVQDRPAPATANGEPRTPPAASGVDASIFDGIHTPSAVPPAAVQPVVWPVPLPLEVARRAVLAALLPGDERGDLAKEVEISADKVAASISSGERAVIEQQGPGSHFADAAGERVVLDVARAEGARLVAASEPSKVDDAAVKALTQRVDAVVARLQKDADLAVAKGEVESLQIVRASSAALSRDLMSFKAAADRLRGLAAAPRLGAGALDPEIVLPGQGARPQPPKPAEAPVRQELKDFEKFQEVTPAARRRTALIVVVVALAAAVVYVAIFAWPRVKELDSASVNIPGVVSVEVGGTSARVVVSDSFAEKPEPGLSQLISLLRE
ncbi:MAG: hypothetical protein ACJ79M_19430, partial [Myxococcales bacterium]